MWKQAYWFAVVGLVVAVLAGGAGDVAVATGPIEIFDGGTSFATRYYGPDWGQLRAIAVAGALVGALTGASTHLLGVRATAPAASRLGRVVTAGLAGVALGLTPALVLVFDAVGGMEPGSSLAVETVTLLTLYGVSAVLVYVASLLAVWVGAASFR